MGQLSNPPPIYAMTPQIDPMLPLAVSVHQNPGVYALLLGSGISLSAGVPTGWGIIVELIQRMAQLEGETVSPQEAEAWYRARTGRGVEYGGILNDLAKSPSERSHLLRGYFEPTPEEREEGLKRPTPAHHAIAELVENGYIRVIVTTNFDRLLEQALQDRGITATLIHTADAVRGARPLAHTACTIIKVHGDYVDARIRNTPEELASYEPELNHLLDQVIDEYGIIVCGWSATWDPALRAAFERARSRRFTTFWATVGEPSTLAQEVIRSREAQIVQIKGADEFFVDLAEKVVALAGIARPHPLSTAVAVETLKRHLLDPTRKIRVHDLVIHETERVLAEISEERSPTVGITASWEHFLPRARHFAATTETLASLLAAGVFHSRGQHDDVWIECLRRLASPRLESLATSAYTRLKGFPGLIAFYTSGIAAVASGQYDVLVHIFNATRLYNPLLQREEVMILTMDLYEVLEKETANRLIGQNMKTPQSEVLHSTIQPLMRPYVGDDLRRFDAVFDRFEYLYCLAFLDERRMSGQTAWGPLGRFHWKSVDIGAEIAAEWGEQKLEWPLLRGGLFGRDLDRLEQSHRELREFRKRVSIY